MPKPVLELPAAVAHDFVDAMYAYFAEENSAMRGQIAVLQLRTLSEHYRGNLRLNQIEAMFHQMREYLEGPTRDIGIAKIRKPTSGFRASRKA